MKIININQTSEREIIKQAVEGLKNGGMVIYPTETCYGIGVDAVAVNAVLRLIKYKGDRRGKPIAVAMASQKMAEIYGEINPAANNLFANFLPGPITVVVRGKHKVAPDLESEKGTLGIRIPDYKLAIKIIEEFGKPITTTSANISHGKTPYSINDILDNIPQSKKDLIDLIIDAGLLPHHPPSTIVDTTLNEPKVLRQGEFIFNMGNVKAYVSEAVEETVNLSELRIKNYELRILKEKCLIFVLQGDLGAGKTQFVKGIARGLGIAQLIKSPTFILCSEYSIPAVIPAQAGIQDIGGKLYHIDTWRMQNESELLDIGFEKMIKPGNVIAIEWGEKVFEILKKVEKRINVQVIWVKIKMIDENVRKIEILE